MIETNINNNPSDKHKEAVIAEKVLNNKLSARLVVSDKVTNKDVHNRSNNISISGDSIPKGINIRNLNGRLNKLLASLKNQNVSTILIRRHTFSLILTSQPKLFLTHKVFETSLSRFDLLTFIEFNFDLFMYSRQM